jgi:hypothetical protein
MNIAVETGPASYMMVTFRQGGKALNIDLALSAPKANKIYTLDSNGPMIICYKVARNEDHEIYSFCVQGGRFKGPADNELIVNVVSNRIDQSIDIEWPDEIPFAACIDPEEIRNWPSQEQTVSQKTLISVQFEILEVIKQMEDLLKDIQKIHAQITEVERDSVK